MIAFCESNTGELFEVWFDVKPSVGETIVPEWKDRAAHEDKCYRIVSINHSVYEYDGGERAVPIPGSQHLDIEVIEVDRGS